LHLRQIKMTEAHLKELGEKIKSWWKKTKKTKKNRKKYKLIFFYLFIIYTGSWLSRRIKWPFILLVLNAAEWFEWCFFFPFHSSILGLCKIAVACCRGEYPKINFQVDNRTI
jgi:hypothetical protein